MKIYKEKKDREIQKLSTENFVLKQQLLKLKQQYDTLAAVSVQLESGIEIFDEKEFNEKKCTRTRRKSSVSKIQPKSITKNRSFTEMSLKKSQNTMRKKNIKQEWMFVDSYSPVKNDQKENIDVSQETLNRKSSSLQTQKAQSSSLSTSWLSASLISSGIPKFSVNGTSSSSSSQPQSESEEEKEEEEGEQEQQYVVLQSDGWLYGYNTDNIVEVDEDNILTSINLNLVQKLESTPQSFTIILKDQSSHTFTTSNIETWTKFIEEFLHS